MQLNPQVLTLENEIEVDILYLLLNQQKEIGVNIINKSKAKLF
jgi:hypothetical protein